VKEALLSSKHVLPTFPISFEESTILIVLFDD
jgi:hypothetical protein